jgi:hypothetical protein
MGTPKKIFFSYSNQEEDLELYSKLNKHFSAYSKAGLLGIIDKATLFKLTADKKGISDILKNADISIPLLSIDFMNDEDCMQQFDDAAKGEKVIIPVLLRDFDLAAFAEIKNYQAFILPNDLIPIENQISSGKSDDTVFKEIAQKVKAIVLPEIGSIVIEQSSHRFYYIIAALVFIIGIVASVTVFNLTSSFGSQQQWLFAILSLLMFGSIALIALKNVLFPNKITIKK